MSTAKKVGAIAGCAAIAVAGVLGGAVAFPVENEVVKEVTVTNTVTKFVNVTNPLNLEMASDLAEVKADLEASELMVVDLRSAYDDKSEDMDKVLMHIFDNDGSVEYLTEDLDDDEVSQIVDRIDFGMKVKRLAVDEVKSELFDELDHEMVSGIELDEDDMSRLKVDDDADEVEILEVDFEDKDAVVQVTGRFEQDRVKFDFVVDIEIRDGEVDEFDLVSVTKR